MNLFPFSLNLKSPKPTPAFIASLFCLSLSVDDRCAAATIVLNYPVTGGSSNLPDGREGLARSVTIATSITKITNLTVGVTGNTQWFGDLFASISHLTGYSVLLNRPGTVVPGDVGSSLAGSYNLTFSDATTTNSHDATSLTGIYKPDAQNPLDNPGTRLAILGSFNGLNPNGVWIWYQEDQASGDLSTITGYSLTISGEANLIWDGGSASGNSTLEASNWVGDLAPEAGDSLTYSGTTRLSPVNILPVGTLLGGITFAAGAGSFQLSGNGVSLANGLISNNSSLLQTIQHGIATSNESTIQTNETGGDFTLSGEISGTGGIRKTGGGKLTLSGVNTFTGNINVSAGTLLLGASNTLPDTATLTLSSGTKLATGGYSDVVGKFSLVGDAILDLGTGIGSRITANDVGTWTGLLSIFNYNGGVWTTGLDKLIFISNTNNASLTNVQFYSDNGVTRIGNGAGFIGTELVPVPETNISLVGLALLGAVVFREYGRKR